MSAVLEQRIAAATRDLRRRAKALRQGGEFCGMCERGMEGEGEGDAKAMELAADLLDLVSRPDDSCDCGRPLVCLCGDLVSDHGEHSSCEYLHHNLRSRCPGGCDDGACAACGGAGHDTFLPSDERCRACGGTGEADS